MNAKAILEGIEELRKYLLGEAPMLTGGLDEDIAHAVPTYFTGTLDRNTEIWKLVEEVQTNPERFAADLETQYRELLRARRERRQQA